MSGNCKNGWDIQVQKDLDAIIKDARECDYIKFNLKNATGSLKFPSISDVQWIKGTLYKDFDALNLTNIMRVENVELMPTKGPDEIVYNKRLELPTMDMYEPSYVGLLKLKDRNDATPPLSMGIEGDPDTLESLVLEDVKKINDFSGSSLDTFKVKNSEWGGDLTRIDHLEVSDMSADRSVSLYKMDWIRNAYFTNIKTDTANLISTQIDSDLFIRDNEDLKQDLDQFFSGFTTVGRDLLMRNNTGLDASFDKLTYAKNITVDNTANSSLAWTALEKAETIRMHSNPATKLPGNMDNLEFVDDIYLNGEMMTDLGPNIFPALRRVTGSVVVEPWNKNFDCRSLVAQWEMGNINKLHCNGTNPHTNSTMESPRLGRRPAAAAAPASRAAPRKPVLTRREIPVVPLNSQGEGAGLVHDHQGLKEVQQDEDGPTGEPCAGAFGGARSIMSVVLVVGLLLLVFVGFRRRRQQQKQQRARIFLAPVEEEGPENEEEKPMMAQRV